MMNATANHPPRIVVGVDGSEESKQALRWAGRLAEIFGARLDVIGAWQVPMAVGWAVATASWSPAEDTEKMLVEVVDEIFGTERPRDLLVTTHEGNAAKLLIDASRNATMVVVGSRGHGGFTGLLIGSTSATLAEHAACPVLVVHGDDIPRVVNA